MNSISIDQILGEKQTATANQETFFKLLKIRGRITSINKPPAKSHSIQPHNNMCRETSTRAKVAPRSP
jgi:hypothetical protein